MRRRLEIIWQDDWPMLVALLCAVAVTILIFILARAHPVGLQFLPLVAVGLLGILTRWISIAWLRRCGDCGGPLKRLRLREIAKDSAYYMGKCQLCHQTYKIAARWQGALTRFPIHDNYLALQRYVRSTRTFLQR